MKYEIQNIVILVTYENTEFELDRLADLLGEARYDPNIFPGVAYKPSDSEASFLIFSSGKMNCVGAKSIEWAERAIQKLTEIFPIRISLQFSRSAFLARVRSACTSLSPLPRRVRVGGKLPR